MSTIPKIVHYIPQCLNNKTTPQVMATGVAADIVFTDADARDVYDLHFPAGGNPERFTIPAGMEGVWDITVNINFSVGVGGACSVELRVGGAAIAILTGQTEAALALAGQLHRQIQLAVGDIVTVNAIQTGVGAGLNLTGVMDMQRVAAALV